MPSADINILAVIIATIAGVLIGAVWFNAPFAFNKIWLEGIGKTAQQVADGASMWSIVGAIIGALITALVLSIFMDWMGVRTLLNGLLVGVLAAVGFSANTAAVKDLFEGRPRKLTLINAAHDVVILAVMGAIIGAIQ